MKYVYSDGGRKEAGFLGVAGDCVARSIAIASGLPYLEVYNKLARLAGDERKSRGASARNGIHTSRKWFKDLMAQWGFTWTPTIGIGTGCKIHLNPNELPMGKLVVSVSKHYTAVIDKIIYDTFDPSREETRCVYGYWTFTRI